MTTAAVSAVQDLLATVTAVASLQEHGYEFWCFEFNPQRGDKLGEFQASVDLYAFDESSQLTPLAARELFEAHRDGMKLVFAAILNLQGINLPPGQCIKLPNLRPLADELSAQTGYAS